MERKKRAGQEERGLITQLGVILVLVLTAAVLLWCCWTAYAPELPQ